LPCSIEKTLNMECYCEARKKPIRHQKTKPQTAPVVCGFLGLLARHELYCDWSVHKKPVWIKSRACVFLTCVVKIDPSSEVLLWLSNSCCSCLPSCFLISFDAYSSFWQRQKLQKTFRYLFFFCISENLPSHMNTKSNRCTSSLKRHLKVKSANKCYKCTQCKKCFNYSSDLKRHRRIHSGEKPYKCTQCKKCFNQSSELKRHLRIHSGEKPYKCT